MALPIVFIYSIGIIFFCLGVEGGLKLPFGKKDSGTNAESNKILYLGISFFVNLMGYLLSYNYVDPDFGISYIEVAYLPLVLLILTVLILLHTVWGMVQPDSWDVDADKDID